jgi:hypothetical protein
MASGWPRNGSVRPSTAFASSSGNKPKSKAARRRMKRARADMRCFDLRQSEQQAASSSPKSAVTMLARSNEECGDDDVAVRTVNFAAGLGLRPIGGLCAAGAGSWRRTRQGIGARTCARFADYPDPAPDGMPVDLPDVKALPAFHPTTILTGCCLRTPCRDDPRDHDGPEALAAAVPALRRPWLPW